VIIVFVGPTLPVKRVEQLLSGTPSRTLPPAAQGDIYRAARHRPDAVVLIDGYFHHVAAVWHKEILWALHEGVTVFGAASMGALRAAELEPFGMIGVGAIFEAYRDGVLVSDDEVAMAHGDVSAHYCAMSEPLVNIRATLARALAEGVITPIIYHAALDTAIELHYADRAYPNVLAHLGNRHDVAALRAWLPQGRIDQKALDAEAVLRQAATLTTPRPVVSWLFERTALWEELVRVQGTRALEPHEARDDEMLEELREDAARYRSVAIPALARLLAVDAARRHGHPLNAEELIRKLDDLRRRTSLHDADCLDQWMTDLDLSVEGLTQLLASESHLDWALEALASDLEPYVLDQLRLTGDYLTRRKARLGERRKAADGPSEG